MLNRYFPEGLALLYALLFLALGWQVADRTVWYAEVTPLLATYALLLLTAKAFRFSNLSYLCFFVPLLWHAIGAHYTFSLVPMDWLTGPLGLDRNPYDRIGHFLVGLFAVPIVELLLRRRLCSPWLAALFAFFAISTVAALYEVIEWAYAALEGGDAGISFLGAQGDPWDAQKDMLADMLGAALTLLLYLASGTYRRSVP